MKQSRTWEDRPPQSVEAANPTYWFLQCMRVEGVRIDQVADAVASPHPKQNPLPTFLRRKPLKVTEMEQTQVR